MRGSCTYPQLLRLPLLLLLLLLLLRIGLQFRGFLSEAQFALTSLREVLADGAAFARHALGPLGITPQLKLARITERVHSAPHATKPPTINFAPMCSSVQVVLPRWVPLIYE